jgi:hypothetical protein
MSQIDRIRGHHQRAAWQQRVATYLAGTSNIGSEGFLNLSKAIRLFRLGHLDKAIGLFMAAKDDVKTPVRSREQAALGLLKCSRLSVNRELFESQAAEIKNTIAFTKDEQLEFEWEEMCWQAVNECDLQPMIKSVSRGRSHYKPTYILESILWIHAVPTKKYFPRIPSLDYLGRKFGGNFKKNKLLLQACKALIDSHNYEIPLHVRLNTISSVMNESIKFVTIERNLLFLIGAARFLIRSKMFSLAELCVLEYSRKLSSSDRHIKNPLVIGHDVVKKFELLQQTSD